MPHSASRATPAGRAPGGSDRAAGGGFPEGLKPVTVDAESEAVEFRCTTSTQLVHTTSTQHD